MSDTLCSVNQESGAPPNDVTSSYPHQIARLFEPDCTRTYPDPGLFHYTGENREQLLHEGLLELRRLARLRHLWQRK